MLASSHFASFRKSTAQGASALESNRRQDLEIGIELKQVSQAPPPGSPTDEGYASNSPSLKSSVSSPDSPDLAFDIEAVLPSASQIRTTRNDSKWRKGQTPATDTSPLAARAALARAIYTPFGGRDAVAQDRRLQQYLDDMTQTLSNAAVSAKTFNEKLDVLVRQERDALTVSNYVKGALKAVPFFVGTYLSTLISEAPDAITPTLQSLTLMATELVLGTLIEQLITCVPAHVGVRPAPAQGTGTRPDCVPSALRTISCAVMSLSFWYGAVRNGLRIAAEAVLVYWGTTPEHLRRAHLVFDGLFGISAAGPGHHMTTKRQEFDEARCRRHLITRQNFIDTLLVTPPKPLSDRWLDGVVSVPRSILANLPKPAITLPTLALSAGFTGLGPAHAYLVQLSGATQQDSTYAECMRNALQMPPLALVYAMIGLGLGVGRHYEYHQQSLLRDVCTVLTMPLRPLQYVWNAFYPATPCVASHIPPAPVPAISPGVPNPAFCASV
ncbi:hypothetical protein PTE30175_05490 [Pandoraea terrae]|uniref:Uncharacterized protein n=2 Tax=Pandoraea terrae TaxID=1537710 RepID=A0A5E4ZGX5_9BURK|nr:hypothetical protein PTE30175_05490 [Pandoraea terrae]